MTYDEAIAAIVKRAPSNLARMAQETARLKSAAVDYELAHLYVKWIRKNATREEREALGMAPK